MPGEESAAEIAHFLAEFGKLALKLFFIRLRQ
jgi:hypothetical protein